MCVCVFVRARARVCVCVCVCKLLCGLSKQYLGVNRELICYKDVKEPKLHQLCRVGVTIDVLLQITIINRPHDGINVVRTCSHIKMLNPH